MHQTSVTFECHSVSRQWHVMWVWHMCEKDYWQVRCVKWHHQHINFKFRSLFKLRNEKTDTAAHRAHYNTAIRSRMGEIMKQCFAQLSIEHFKQPYQDPRQRSLRLLISTCSLKMLKLVEILRDIVGHGMRTCINPTWIGVLFTPKGATKTNFYLW